MNKLLRPQLFWVSLLIHVFVLILIDLSYRDSHIQKLFVAYGTHSKRYTQAYFREVKAPSGYQKYLRSRQGTFAVKKTENPAVKKLAKKDVSKNKIKLPAKKSTPVVKTQATTVEKPPVKKVVKKEPPKKEVPKEELKKEVEKKEEPKKEVEKKEEPKEVEPTEKEETSNVEENVSAGEDESDEQEVLHFNLMGESDPKVLVYQQHIQIEVDRLWRPPLGVPKGTECTVSFEIGRDGEVKTFKIDKKSKMPIYDLSITRVGKEFKFNECLWGKSFTISFRQ